MTQQTAVMQLIKFILIERRQEDGSIKFHAHEDFSRFLQMEKEQIVKAHNNAVVSPYTDLYAWETKGKSQITKGEQYYNETYGKE